MSRRLAFVSRVLPFAAAASALCASMVLAPRPGPAAPAAKSAPELRVEVDRPWPAACDLRVVHASPAGDRACVVAGRDVAGAVQVRCDAVERAPTRESETDLTLVVEGEDPLACRAAGGLGVTHVGLGASSARLRWGSMRSTEPEHRFAFLPDEAASGAHRGVHLAGRSDAAGRVLMGVRLGLDDDAVTRVESMRTAQRDTFCDGLHGRTIRLHSADGEFVRARGRSLEQHWLAEAEGHWDVVCEDDQASLRSHEGRWLTAPLGAPAFLAKRRSVDAVFAPIAAGDGRAWWLLTRHGTYLRVFTQAGAEGVEQTARPTEDARWMPRFGDRTSDRRRRDVPTADDGPSSPRELDAGLADLPGQAVDIDAVVEVRDQAVEVQ